MARRNKAAAAKKQPVRIAEAAPAAVAAPPAAAPRLRFSAADIRNGTLLFIALIIAYFPALTGAQVWDDAGHITPAKLRSLEGLYRIWFQFGASQQYYPLLHSAFWVEHRIWGDWVVGYHVITLVFHAIAAYLIVAIMRRLSLPGGWLAASIFALHPVSTESVAWISEQKNTLSAVFYLSSAFCYLRFDKERRRTSYALALLFYVLALLSKSVAATLPVTLLLVFWWQRGSVRVDRDVKPLLPWFAVGAASGALTAWVEKTYIGAQGTDFSLNIIERCLVAGRVIWFYLLKLIWPVKLLFIYPRWTIDAGEAWQYLFPLLTIGVAVGLWMYSRKAATPQTRAPLAVFLCFIAALAPALGFVNVYPFIYSYVADHFQYQAMIAIFIAAAAWLVTLTRRLPGDRARLAPIAAGVVLLAFGALTWRQTGLYLDEATLYRKTLAENPRAFMAWTNLALVLDRTPGHEQEAIRLTKKALEIRPNSAEAMNNIGMFLEELNRHAESLAAYRKAAELSPTLEAAHWGIANGLAAMPGREEEAIREYQIALRLKPEDERAFTGLGRLYLRMPGHLQDAIANFQMSARLDPGSYGPHIELGEALTRAGDTAGAIAEYRKAIQFKADYPEAHLNLGAALALSPDTVGAALEEYRTAIRLKPHYAQAHYNLGLLLSDMPGRANEAIAEYQAALREKPDYAEALCNLGIALEDIPGRKAEAIEKFRAAVKADPHLAEAQYAWGMALADAPQTRIEAIDHFRAAAKANPNFQPAQDVLTKLGIPH
ncbi:MAG TPA: tetratricopeptide repeat protein [Bryobacteraceae bacterium]|nr:tetratricopeptide repeat protein [Bryobacteraceae bacterium]